MNRQGSELGWPHALWTRVVKAHRHIFVELALDCCFFRKITLEPVKLLGVSKFRNKENVGL
jgi:hypothetical protein